jgi:hypothetical protein
MLGKLNCAELNDSRLDEQDSFAFVDGKGKISE